MERNSLRAADGVVQLATTGVPPLQTPERGGGGVGGAAVVGAGTAPGFNAGSGGGGPALPVVPLHLIWKEGARAQFDTAVVFESAAVSRLTARQLAQTVFKGALAEHAEAFQSMEEEMIGAAQDNLLLGLSVTCGAVSPAEVEEQLVSRRVTHSNKNLLQRIARLVKKWIGEHAVATAVLATSNLGGEDVWDDALAAAGAAAVRPLQGDDDEEEEEEDDEEDDEEEGIRVGPVPG